MIIGLVFAVITLKNGMFTWISGDNDKFLKGYIIKSDSNIASKVRHDDIYIYSNGNSILQIPLFSSLLGEKDSKLFMSAFSTTTLKEGILSDLPTEFSIVDYISGKF